MATKTEHNPRIIRGRTLIQPFGNDELTFVHPNFGPGNYRNVGISILEDRSLRLSTGVDVAPLVNAAYCSKEVQDEPEFSNVRNLMKNNGIWVYNRVLWAPQGAYIVQDPYAIGTSEELEIGPLETILADGTEIGDGIRFSNDKTVRFAPKATITLGEQDYPTLARNGFLIASYDEEGAEQLAEASTKFRNNPYVSGVRVNEGEKPITRVSALYSVWGFDGRLDVLGYNHGNDWGGCSFGVSRTGEASRSKK